MEQQFEREAGARFQKATSGGGGNGRRGGHMQDDYRNDPVPVEERSLEDYVTFKPARRPKKGRQKQTHRESDEANGNQEAQSLANFPTEAYDGSQKTDNGEDTQLLLEREYPDLDTSLIAAIVAERNDIDGCRNVLKAIAG